MDSLIDTQELNQMRAQVMLRRGTVTSILGKEYRVKKDVDTSTWINLSACSDTDDLFKEYFEKLHY